MKASTSNATYAEKTLDYEIGKYDFSEPGNKKIKVTQTEPERMERKRLYCSNRSNGNRKRGAGDGRQA